MRRAVENQQTNFMIVSVGVKKTNAQDVDTDGWKTQRSVQCVDSMRTVFKMVNEKMELATDETIGLYNILKSVVEGEVIFSGVTLEITESNGFIVSIVGVTN